MKILCTADIHIGRRAARVPDRTEARGFAAAGIWDDIVELAIEENVALLLLAGDVVEWENRFFEAYGPLERGLKRLEDAGIQTCAVAGNHDIEVLPRLAEAMGSRVFHLLGHAGEWERRTITEGGRPLLHIDGWSFPTRYVRQSPLISYPQQLDDRTPVLVVLHADLDQTGSGYAPVGRSELERASASFWLLGHVHHPLLTRIAGGAQVLYPGSPLALDPGERGSHGPWLLEVREGIIGQPVQVPLSPVRYEQVEVSVDGVDNEEDLQARIPTGLQSGLSALINDWERLECVCARLVLTGRTGLHRRMESLGRSLVEELVIPVQGATAVVEKVECRTHPDINLNELASGASPPAILARLLLELEVGALSEKGEAVLRGMNRGIEGVHSARPYSAVLEDARPNEEAVREIFRQAGLSLLDALLSQKTVDR